MKIIIALIFAGSMSAALSGQNLLDEQGRKTGHWKKEYPNGKTMYEGEFREGKPVGEMLRYHDNGTLSARIHFMDGGKRHASLYFESGKLAASGIYLEENKDSVWTYYSERDGSVRIRERYSQGKLDGPTRRYYPEGAISEEITWSVGMKEGAWRQYYEDGSLRLHGHYSADKLNGPYKVWFPGGVLMVEGEMKENRSEGMWNYYNEEGDVLFSLEYRDGVPTDRELYNKLMNDDMLKADSIRTTSPGQPF